MNYKKSSVSAWNTTSQTLPANTTVVLTNSKNTGCSIKFAPGTSSFTLLRPGLYYISVTASGAQSATDGNLTIQLFSNGMPVAGALSTANSSSATDTEALSFNKLIEVKPMCPVNSDPIVLTIVNTGVSATYTNFNVNLFKLA